MDSKKMEEKTIQEYWHNLLKGKSFEEACRTYVLKVRSPQYLAIQPIEENQYINGRRVHFFQKAMKHFSSEDPALKHCYSREELIAEASAATGLPEQDAYSLLQQLFTFQPELTFSKYGAVCKNVSFPELELSGSARSCIPYDILKKELPDEWYVSLQIPEKIIDKMVWGCRKTGMPKPHSCSSHFAEQLLRLYKRRRGEFIQQYSFEKLKFFWLEYGSMQFAQDEINAAVSAFLLSDR